MVGGVNGELGAVSATGGSADSSVFVDTNGIPANDGPADTEGFASSPIVPS